MATDEQNQGLNQININQAAGLNPTKVEASSASAVPDQEKSNLGAQSKKPFALRISSQTMEALEHWAAQEFRSVNGQIEYLLSKAIKEHFKKEH
jgi:hypothetical protein